MLSRHDTLFRCSAVPLFRIGNSLFYDADGDRGDDTLRIMSLAPAPVGGPEVTFAATDIVID